MPTTTARTDQSHPLEIAVRAVFAKRSPLDRTTLAMGLAGDPHSAVFIASPKGGPKLGISPNRAYLAVAEDVLGSMLDQGKLARDESEWYHLAPDEAA